MRVALREWARRHEEAVWAGALAAVTAFGLAWRFVQALRPARLPDEEICIGMAEAILRPGTAWPLHGGDHPLLGIYLLAGSAWLFGPNLIGYRLLGVLAGGLTPLAVAAAVSRSAPRSQGLLAAALLAANPLHAGLSALAFELPFQILFASLSWWCLAVWPERGGRALVGAACFLGLAFLCSESAALLGLGWALVLLWHSEHRRRLTRGAALLALAAFLAVISVDVFYNLTATRADFAYVNYLDHMSRIVQPTVSLQGLGFFLRDVFNAAWGASSLWQDHRCEYPGPGVGWGILFLVGALHGLLAGGDPSRGLWAVPPLLFVLVTTLLGPAAAGDLDPPSWTWPLPSLPLVVACTATMISRRWRLLWPLLPALLLARWLTPTPLLEVCR